MKKLIPMFLIFILIFFTFAVEVCAFSDSFDMTIPDYYEKVSDNEWHTDKLMIDNLPTEVTLTVEFYDAENSLSDFSFSLGYLKYHDEIIAREDFKEFIDGAKSTMSTAEGYEVRCASYVSSVDETEKAVCTYSFFADNQTCTFTFVADNIQFALAGEVEKIINTVIFEEDFFKTEDVEKVTVTYQSPELPKVPAIEFYTEIMTSASYGNIAHKGDSSLSMSGKVAAVVFVVCVVLIVAVILKKKSVSKNESYKAYMTVTENQPKEEKRFSLLYEGDRYQGSSIELKIEDDGKALIINNGWWPAHRGATNGGQIIDELETDYFQNNTIDDFADFLSEKYKKDFSHIRNRKDIKSLFKCENRPSGRILVKETIVKQTEPAKGASFSFEKDAFTIDIVTAEDRDFVRITNYCCYSGANGRPQYKLVEKYYDLSQVDSDGITADNYREKIKGEPIYHYQKYDWGHMM